MDVLLRGVTWLQNFRQRQLVESCQYVQDGIKYSNVDLTVAYDASNSETDEIVMNYRAQDFLVSAAHFAAKGIDKPKRGDRVLRNVGSEQIEYDVVATDSEPHYRPMSRYHQGWRIHTVRKRIGSIESST
jgi:hypothetical protein